jgi:hypothetical protein
MLLRSRLSLLAAIAIAAIPALAQDHTLQPGAPGVYAGQNLSKAGELKQPRILHRKRTSEADYI